MVHVNFMVRRKFYDYQLIVMLQTASNFQNHQHYDLFLYTQWIVWSKWTLNFEWETSNIALKKLCMLENVPC